MQLCDLCRQISPRSLVPALPPDYSPADGSGPMPTQAQMALEASRERRRVFYRHHETPRDLRLSSLGCPLCRLFTHALFQLPIESPRETWPWPDEPMLELEGVPSLQMEIFADDQRWGRPAGQKAELVQVLLKRGSKKLRLMNVYADKDSPAALSGDVAGRQPRSDFDTGRYFQTPRRWLQECLLHHSECKLATGAVTDSNEVSLVQNQPASDGLVELPTRVIDVTRLQQPRLIETAKLNSQFGRYAALSHCWGLLPALTTTKATYESRLHSITLDTLPKTFREAVSVTRWLGLQYLWIDALCIVQDDAEDWRRESAKMGRIYHTAHVTISATSAKDHSEGLFMPRPTPNSNHPPVKMPYVTRDDTDGGSYYIACRQASFPLLEKTGALNRRGWTLQEKILSRRILHFAEDQIYWECMTHKRAEDGSPFDDETDFGESGLRLMRRPVLFPHLRFERGVKLPEGYDFMIDCVLPWARLVEEFTHRDLKYQSDKLPAMQGIANALKYTSGSEYCAGMWRNCLDLLWRRPKDAILTTPETARAPSWSWAAVDGPVQYSGLEPWPFGDNYPSTKDVEINSVSVEEHVSRNSSGINVLVTTGCVTLRARYNVAFRLDRIISDSFDPWKNFDYGARKRHRPDASPLEGKYPGSYTRNGQGHHPLVARSGHSAKIVGWGAFDDKDWPTNRLVICILVDRLGSAYKPRNFYVLLVVKEGETRVRRVGMGQITEEDWFEASERKTFLLY